MRLVLLSVLLIAGLPLEPLITHGGTQKDVPLMRVNIVKSERPTLPGQTLWKPVDQFCSVQCGQSTFSAGCATGQNCDCSCDKIPVCECK
jgi:hypothetical protein